MADTKITKTFAEMEEEADRNLNQFAFLLFIPNPTTKTVKYYVDGEKVIYVKNKDDFIKIIKSVCGVEESNRIEVACMEYGIPFLYDRTKKLLKQVPSKSLDRNMDLSEKQVLKSIANEKQNQTTEIDSVFQAVLANKLY